jgi:hypothetical protein
LKVEVVPMARKSMKAALSNSLKAEDEAVKSRFEKAESYLERASDHPTGAKDEQPESPFPHPQRQEPESRTKVIRDSFTLPEDDYTKIAALQERCLGLAKNVTKSEVMRAGLHALEALSDEDLLSMMDGLVKVKAGRPSRKR